MATISPILTDSAVLEAATDSKLGFIQPTDNSVLGAQADLPILDPGLGLNLKSSNIELPADKDTDEASPILAGMEKLFDSIKDSFRSTVDNRSTVNSATANNTTNISNANQALTNQLSETNEPSFNSKSFESVFNSILSTTKSLLIEPRKSSVLTSGVDRENNSLQIRDELSLLKKSAETNNSQIKESILNNTSLTESKILEKEIQSLATNPTNLSELVSNSTTQQNLLSNSSSVSNSSQTDNVTSNSTVSNPTTGGVATEDPLRIKSTKLVDSKMVNTMLAPDRTVEKTVQQLSKDLPAAVNSLSTSVTSLGGQQSSVTNNISNAGPSFDQSTNINNPAQRVASQESTQKASEAAPEQTPNQSHHYLQAIYAALMSGKVKVKLEHS